MRARPVPTGLLAVPLAAVLLLAGCSAGGAGASGGGAGSTTASPAASNVGSSPSAAPARADLPANPCAYLSKAEAAKALGSTVASTSRQDTNCTFAVGDDDELGFGLEVYPNGGDLQWQAALIGTKAQFDKAPPIAGLGDRAFGIGGHLTVQKGPTVVEIDDDQADRDPHLDHAIALVKIVLTKL